jgi:hypothetical protein
MDAPTQPTRFPGLRAPDPAATVVVCEDDAPTLELLCDHLRADRYEPLAAPSATDALRLCHFKAWVGCALPRPTGRLP